MFLYQFVTQYVGGHHNSTHQVSRSPPFQYGRRHRDRQNVAQDCTNTWKIFWWELYNFDERIFQLLYITPKTIPKHVEKKFWKNLNYSLSYGYQHPQDHDGVEGKYVLEAGDLVDWDFSKFSFLPGLGHFPHATWGRWEGSPKIIQPFCQMYFFLPIRTPPIPRPKRPNVWVAHGRTIPRRELQMMPC